MINTQTFIVRTYGMKHLLHVTIMHAIQSTHVVSFILQRSSSSHSISFHSVTQSHHHYQQLHLQVIAVTFRSISMITGSIEHSILLNSVMFLYCSLLSITSTTSLVMFAILFHLVQTQHNYNNSQLHLVTHHNTYQTFVSLQD